MNNMTHVADRRSLLHDTRGATGSSYVMTILLVAVVGIGGFQTLGGGMGKAIGEEGGQGMAVSVQAGEEGPPPGTTIPTTTTVPPAPPVTAAQPGEGPYFDENGKFHTGGYIDSKGNWHEGEPDASNGFSINATDTKTPVSEPEATEPERERYDCGANPFCYVSDFTSEYVGDSFSELSDRASQIVGDIPVLGPAIRFTAGLADGIWDGVWEIGRGIKELVESVVWDFLVEDVLAGTVKGLAGVGCKLISFGQACHDSSWNPIKSTTNSIGNFFTKLPEMRHVVGNALHQASLCTNPWNGQTAEARGHACGETVVSVVDIIFATKGLTKLAKIAKEALLARRAATAAEAAAAADAVDAGKSGKTTLPDEGKGPGGGKGPGDDKGPGGDKTPVDPTRTPPSATVAAEGLSKPLIDSALDGMKKDGGHATRHFVEAGPQGEPPLIPNKGSLASRVDLFKEMVSPILEKPLARIIDAKGRHVEQFIGRINGQLVRVDRALSGDYVGKIETAVVLNPEQIAGVAEALGITEQELLTLGL